MRLVIALAFSVPALCARAEPRPLRWQPSDLDLRGGLAFSLVDGYPGTRNDETFFAPIPFLTLEGRRLGANVLILPNRRASAVAVQLKLKPR